MRKDPTAKPSITMIAVIAISAVVGSVVASAVVKTLFGSKNSNASVDEVLAESADQINRNLPMMVDQFTRLDSTFALPQRRLLYKYTIVNTDPLPTRASIVDNLRPRAINNFKTSQEMADLRKMSVTLVYSYTDDEGNELAQFEVGPEDIE